MLVNISVVFCNLYGKITYFYLYPGDLRTHFYFTMYSLGTWPLFDPVTLWSVLLSTHPYRCGTWKVRRIHSLVCGQMSWPIYLSTSKIHHSSVAVVERRGNAKSGRDLLQTLSGYAALGKVLNSEYSIVLFGKEHTLQISLEQWFFSREKECVWMSLSFIQKSLNNYPWVPTRGQSLC